MSTDRVRRVAVIGAGLMGHGIAQDFATAGWQVALADVSSEKAQQALRSVEQNLRMLVGLGVLQQERIAAILAGIEPVSGLKEAVAGASLVIESVFENLELKQAIFRELDTCCAEETILATNSSAIMPGQLAHVTRRPERVIGMHFFSPPYLVPLVEVIATGQTPEAVIESALAILNGLGKKPAVLRKEVPGFLANRLQCALAREAIALVAAGVATPRAVDDAIRFGLSRRWAAAGVFELFDLAGWDTVLAAANLILPSLESSSDSSALRGKVERGELGAKAGRGFYEWTPGQVDEARKRVAASLLQR